MKVKSIIAGLFVFLFIYSAAAEEKILYSSDFKSGNIKDWITESFPVADTLKAEIISIPGQYTALQLKGKEKRIGLIIN